MPASNEELLISAVLRTQNFAPVLKAGLTSDMFLGFKEEFLWIHNYYSKSNRAPTKATFKARFSEFVVYKVDDADYFAHEVLKDHSRRTLMEAMDKSLDDIEKGNFDRATKHLGSSLLTVQAQLEGRSEHYEASVDWNQTYEMVRAKAERVRQQGIAGVPTGWPTLDLVTGGYQEGWLTIVAARLGQGKTWTMIRSAWEAMHSGHRVLYFSLEQSRHQIAMRFHSFASKHLTDRPFDSRDLMRGFGFSLERYRQFLETLADEVDGHFFVRDTTRGKVSVNTIQAALEETKADIVFVDYLTLMSGAGADWQEIARLSGDLKQVAERWQVPIVAASQINRAALQGALKGRPPGAEHIAQADAIGQDADLIVSLQQMSKNVQRMMVAKFRHGDSGLIWDCHFNPGQGIFDEVDANESARLQEKDAEID